MKKEELLDKLLQAHREIGQLEAQNSETREELHRMRQESLNPREFRKLLEEALAETDSIVPMVKLIRAVTGLDLADSKTMFESTAVGHLLTDARTRINPPF